MLQTIRERASGWIAYIIIGLLIIPFALWGINSYFGGAGPLVVAKVGDSEISLQEFQRAYQQERQQQRQRLQAMLGDNFDPALLEGPGFKQQVLQGLIDRRLLIRTARTQGLGISDEQLSQDIQSYPIFQQNGKFDRERYERMLSSQGYSKSAFEESQRSALMLSQLQEGLVTSAIVTSQELDRLVALMKQKRELAYIVLSLDHYLAKTTVDEDAIQSYYQENKNQFLSPEQVKLSYLELTQEGMAKDIPVSEDELRALYQEQIAKYVQPEQRRASHILVTVPDSADPAQKEAAKTRAQKIYQEIASGQKTFAEALKEVQGKEGIEGGDLGIISHDMLDPAFESALYSLKSVGDVSEPVSTSFGYHIIRLDEIIPEQRKSFEEVRDEVAKEVRQRKAEARFYDVAQNLTNLSYEQPDSLKPAAETLGLEVKQSDWLTRNSREGIAAYPKVIKAAFSEEVLKEGFNSEPIEVEPGHVIVVRVLAHKEAAPRSLEQARDDIKQQLRRRRAGTAMEKDIAMLREKITQGEDLQALAKEFNGELKKPGLTSRSEEGIDNNVLAQAFQLPKPGKGKVSVGSAVLSNGDQAVIVVSRIVPGGVKDFSKTERTALAQRLEQQEGLTQFQGFLEGLRKQADIVTYPDKLP
jgi:peptidyl-prolyl cis-trans isomerase D